MIKSFFRNPKVIIYSVVIVLLSVIISTSFNLLHYFKYIYNEEINNKNYRILIIEESANINLDDIRKIENVKDVFYFYDMLNIEVDKYENVSTVKESLQSMGYTSKQAGETTIKQLIEQTNTIETIIIVNVIILIAFIIIILSLFVSLMIKDEKKDIALLKCIGYTKGKILKILILRVTILIGISSIIGVIIAKSLGIYIEKMLNIILDGIYPFNNIISELSYTGIINNYFSVGTILINILIGIILVLGLNQKIEYKNLKD